MPRRRIDDQPFDLAIGKCRQLACEVVKVAILAEDGAVELAEGFAGKRQKVVAQQAVNVILHCRRSLFHEMSLVNCWHRYRRCCCGGEVRGSRRR